MTQEQTDITEAIVEQNTGITFKHFYNDWMRNMGDNARLAGPDRLSVADFNIAPHRDKDTLIIVGPGASLSLYVDRFPELQEAATIVTSPTALHWAKHNGFKPDIVVVADSDAVQYQLLESAGNTAPVFAGVTSNPGIARQQVYWYTPLAGNGKAKIPESIPASVVNLLRSAKDYVPIELMQEIDEVLTRGIAADENPMAIWDIPAMLLNQDIDWCYPSAGCVVNAAVQIVQSLRAKGTLRARRIVLLGCDFGPWGGYYRCPPNKNVTDYPAVDNEIGLFRWDDCLTDPVGLMYKRVMLRLWQESLLPIYTMSHGLLHEFPRVTVDNVLRDQFPEYMTKREVNALCDQFYSRFADDFPRVTIDHFDSVEASVTAGIRSVYSVKGLHSVISGMPTDPKE